MAPGLLNRLNQTLYNNTRYFFSRNFRTVNLRQLSHNFHNTHEQNRATARFYNISIANSHRIHNTRNNLRNRLNNSIYQRARFSPNHHRHFSRRGRMHQTTTKGDNSHIRLLLFIRPRHRASNKRRLLHLLTLLNISFNNHMRATRTLARRHQNIKRTTRGQLHTRPIFRTHTNGANNGQRRRLVQFRT